MTTLKTLTAAVAFATFGLTAPAALAQSSTTSAPPTQQQGTTGSMGGDMAQQQGTTGSMGSDMGQQQGATGSMGATSTPTARLSDEELEKFASAESKVSEIRDEFSEKLADADSQEKAQSLQLEAQEKMVEAVREEGLEIPTYNEIAVRMQSDPQLQQRISSMN